MQIAKNLNITVEMLNIISEIDEFKRQWKEINDLTPEKLTNLKKVATIESVGSSNRIEGNKLSDNHVEELLAGLGKQSFKNRDEEEVAGYAELMDTIFENYEIIPISENYLKQFHKILLEHSSKDERHKSEYKKMSNSVSAFNEDGTEVGIVFQTSDPFETPYKMEELVRWLRQNIEDNFYHPLLVIGIFIVHFLAIHPFQDGNGRISRAMTSFLLLKTGYLYMPYSSMESIIEDNKNGYYRALRESQITLESDNPNYEPWLLFFLRTLQKQKIRLEYKLKEQSKLSKNNYLELPELSANIMKLFEVSERLTISYIEEKLNANRNTIKKHLKSLCDNSYIQKNGTTKNVWYTKTE